MVTKIWAAAVLTTALAAPVYVQGQEVRFDPAAIATLPAYCKHTQGFSVIVPGGNNAAQIKRWSELIGPMFIHMHHYCHGLIATHKALLARTRFARMYQLNIAISEINYVVQRAPANFALLPEMLTRRGENLIRRGDARLGMAEFHRAIELKPDYWPPYAALSDHFKQTGDVATAREWLEKALAIAPEVNTLKTRLAELDDSKGRRKATPEPAQEQVRIRATQPDRAQPATEKPIPDPTQEPLEPRPPGGG